MAETEASHDDRFLGLKGDASNYMTPLYHPVSFAIHMEVLFNMMLTP
jgi:hypothetical protein